MRRLICLAFAVMLCMSLACPAFAANFVPSISYKDGPELVSAEMNGESVGDCLVVTSILEAEEKKTDITQEERDLLLEVYQKLSDGSMKLPLEEDHVIRELVDVSFKKTACRDPQHGHMEWLDQENTSIKITFDLGVAKNDDVTVLSYTDDTWEVIENVVNHGDGTVTVEFEHFCPVAFCLPVQEQPPVATAPKTGDQSWLWMTAMVISGLALVALLAVRPKMKKQ